MARKKTPPDDGASVVDLINNAFGFDDEETEETPKDRYLRTGKKMPPPNNPTTPEGRAWIKANLKKEAPEKGKKKRPR